MQSQEITAQQCSVLLSLHIIAEKSTCIPQKYDARILPRIYDLPNYVQHIWKIKKYSNNKQIILISISLFSAVLNLPRFISYSSFSNGDFWRQVNDIFGNYGDIILLATIIRIHKFCPKIMRHFCLFQIIENQNWFFNCPQSCLR